MTKKDNSKNCSERLYKITLANSISIKLFQVQINCYYNDYSKLTEQCNSLHKNQIFQPFESEFIGIKMNKHYTLRVFVDKVIGLSMLLENNPDSDISAADSASTFFSFSSPIRG